MPIIAKDNSTSFEPAPEGLHHAVCCDVVDKGLIASQWGMRHRVQVRWQLEENQADGKPYMAVRTFTLSLAEKSNLRPFLEAWRGKRFSAEEIKGFDLEKLIGVNCQLQVIQKVTDGQIYANVQTAVPLGKGIEKLAVRDYIRQVDRVMEDMASDRQPPDDDDDAF